MSDFNDTEYTRWLDSSVDWKLHFPPLWHGTKVLGQGSYGMAGLWQYKAPYPNSQKPLITDIVVKQCEVASYNPPELALVEGTILNLLSTVRSRHILRLYRPLVLEIHEPKKVEVVRLFLEYCPGGDLNKLISSPNKVPKQPPLKEVDLWAMFYCLALGISVMDRGTEDGSLPPWARSEIAHYDLRSDNVFMGYRDEDHIRYPVLKIADFGTAIEEPRVETQDAKTGIGNPLAGDLFVRPPEADSRNNRKRVANSRKGTCSNIWQVGCVMHCLMTRVKKDFTLDRGVIRRMIGSWPRGAETSGMDLDKNPTRNLYSRSLRELVMECMLWEPLHRPRALDLQKRVKKELDAEIARAEKDGTLGDIERLLDIPMQDVIWPEPPNFLQDPVLPIRLPGTSPSQAPGSPLRGGGTVQKREDEDNDDGSLIRDIKGKRRRLSRGSQEQRVKGVGEESEEE